MISRILNFKRALVKCLIFSIFSCVFLDAKPTSSNILVDLNEDANHSFNLSDFQFNDVNGSQIILTPLLFHEEFESYDLGSIIGIEGTGLGQTGNWVHSSVNGTFQVGNGLCGPRVVGRF